MISRRQANRAVEIHADDLSEYANVVGMGVRKVDGEDEPASQADHGVAVYVTRKKDEDELEPDDVLPEFVEIPGRGTTHKVPVQVIEIGAMKAQDKSEPGPKATTEDGDEQTTKAPEKDSDKAKRKATRKDSGKAERGDAAFWAE